MWGTRCPGGTCTNTEMTNEFLGIQEFGESTHSIPMHVGLNVQTIIAFIVTLQLRVTGGRIHNSCHVFFHISVLRTDLHEKTLMNNYLWCKCQTQRLSNCVFGLECCVSALFMQLVSRHTFTFLMPGQLISPSIHHTFSFASLLIRCNTIFCTAPCELVGWTIYSSK